MNLAREPFPELTGPAVQRLKTGSERIVVIGAGGWIGRATLELLHGLLGRAFHDRVVAFGSEHRALHLRRELIVMQHPLATLKELERRPTLALHFAFLTQEKAKRMSEADYVAANKAISGAVLEALEPIGAGGVFVASSGAVHLAKDESAEASKRLYGALKLEDEAAFEARAEAGGARAVLGRIFNVSGPYLSTGGAYALAAFIDDALHGRPITVRARHRVLRSYIAISELMSVVFASLGDRDRRVTRFETAGDQELEMGEVALAVQQEVAPASSVVRPPVENHLVDRYVGDGTVYRELRHRFDVEAVDFRTQVRQTAAYMASAAIG